MKRVIIQLTESLMMYVVLLLCVCLENFQSSVRPWNITAEQYKKCGTQNANQIRKITSA